MIHFPLSLCADDQASFTNLFIYKVTIRPLGIIRFYLTFLSKLSYSHILIL